MQVTFLFSRLKLKLMSQSCNQIYIFTFIQNQNQNTSYHMKYICHTAIFVINTRIVLKVCNNHFYEVKHSCINDLCCNLNFKMYKYHNCV